MKHLLAAAVALTATTATAGPDRAYVLAGSHHINGEAYGFNEVNPGVFLTWEQARFDITVGAYLNSYSKGSAAISVAYPLARGDNWSVDVFGGLATYVGTSRPDIQPMGGLQVRYGPAFVQLIPTPGAYVDGIISFGMTFEIGE